MLEIGREYTVRHVRKGTFTIRVKWQDDAWIMGVITEGKAQAGTRWHTAGMEITMRKSLARLTEKVVR